MTVKITNDKAAAVGTGPCGLSGLRAYFRGQSCPLEPSMYRKPRREMRLRIARAYCQDLWCWCCVMCRAGSVA